MISARAGSRETFEGSTTDEAVLGAAMSRPAWTVQPKPMVGGVLPEIDRRRMVPAFWTVLGMGVAIIAFLCFVNVDDYSSGPALIRPVGNANVIANGDGVVATIEVAPGQRISRGQTVARLHPGSLGRELEKIEDEWENHLAQLLRAPADENAAARVASLRADRERLRARLHETYLTTSEDGVVGQVWVTPGQAVRAGDRVVALMSSSAAFELVAFLPGHARPFVHPGATLRLEAEGATYAYQELPITFVADEAIGPAEARRYLGSAYADALAIDGASIIVRARLVSPFFSVDGENFSYYAGLKGRAWARTGRMPILMRLMPALRLLQLHRRKVERR